MLAIGQLLLFASHGDQLLEFSHIYGCQLFLKISSVLSCILVSVCLNMCVGHGVVIVVCSPWYSTSCACIAIQVV